MPYPKSRSEFLRIALGIAYCRRHDFKELMVAYCTRWADIHCADEEPGDDEYALTRDTIEGLIDSASDDYIIEYLAGLREFPKPYTIDELLALASKHNRDFDPRLYAESFAHYTRKAEQAKEAAASPESIMLAMMELGKEYSGSYFYGGDKPLSRKVFELAKRILLDNGKIEQRGEKRGTRYIRTDGVLRGEETPPSIFPLRKS